MRTLYVGGLAPEVDDAALRDLFEHFGDVADTRVVTSLETGESRGFGYVTFASELSAHCARKALDGRDRDGSTLRVAPAA
jgi:RNA recognition motif-containing protein